MRPGFCGLRFIQKDLAQYAVRHGIVWKALQFRPEFLLGKFVLALPPILEAQAGMRSREVRIRRHRRLIFFDGFRSIRHLVISRSHHDVSRRRVWIYLHDSSEYARECLVVLHPQVCFTEHVEGFQVGWVNMETLDMLGKAYLRMKDYKALTSVFTRIMQVNPNSASAHIMMGTAYDQMSNRPEAIKEYQAAVAADPNFTGAHSGLGFEYWREGENELAEKEFRTE